MNDIDEPIEPVKKKAGRPKRAAAPVGAQMAASAGVALTAEQFMALMNQQAEILRANKQIDIEVAATVNAQAMKKALHPENEIAPGISVYNPLGEHKHPREKPTHIYMIGPYPICDPGNYDTTTATEIALLNRVKAGAYTVTKADGTILQMLVKTETNGAGKPYRTVLFADGKGIADEDQKNNWTPLMTILNELVLGETPQASYARMQAQIDELTAKLAATAA